jgi:hypothetical protein
LRFMLDFPTVLRCKGQEEVRAMGWTRFGFT